MESAGALDPINVAVWNILVPVTISALVALIGWRLWNRRSEPIADGFWAAPLGISLGFVVGYVGVLWPEKMIPLNRAWHWLIPVAGVGLAAGLADTFAHMPRGQRLFTTFVACSLTMFMMLQRKLTQSLYTEWQTVVITLVLAAATWAVWHATEVFAEYREGGLVPLLLTLLTTALSLTMLMSGSVRGAQMSGVLAAATGPWLVAGFWKPIVSFARGALGAWLLVYAGLLAWSACYVPDFPGVCTVLLAAAPFAAWVGYGRWTSTKPLLAAVSSTAAVVAISVCSVVWAYMKSPPLDY